MISYILRTIKLKYYVHRCYSCKSFYLADDLHKPLAQLSPDSIPKLIELTQLHGFDYRVTRSIAYGALGLIDDHSTEITDTMVEGIHDNDFEVRRKVVSSISNNIKNGNTSESLITALLFIASNDDNTENQLQALRAIGALKDKRAISPLIPLLDNDRLRGEVLDVLGEIGDKKAVEPIISFLKSTINDLNHPIDSEYEFAIRYAIEALGKIKDKRAIPILLHIFEVTKDSLIAAFKWGESGFHDEIALSLNKIGFEDITTLAMEVVKIGWPENSLEILKEKGDQRAIPIILDFILSHEKLPRGQQVIKAIFSRCIKEVERENLESICELPDKLKNIQDQYTYTEDFIELKKIAFNELNSRNK